MGLAGMLIPLVSVAVVLTLLPALLSSIGPRVDYPRIRKEGTASRGWSAWARLIVRHRVIATAAAVVMLALLIIPVFSLKIGPGSSLESLAHNGPRYDALQTLTDGGVGTGVITPIEVLVPAGDAQAAAEAARGVDGVQLAVVGTTARRQRRRRRPADRRHARTATPRRSSTTSGQRSSPSVGGEVGITGARRDHRGLLQRGLRQVPLRAGADRADHLRAAGPHLPVRAAAAQGRAAQPDLDGGRVRRRSCSSGSWATGPTRSSTSSPTGAINFWLPVVIFAFLFGLSMDYEVFILARMREEYDRTGDTSMAVITGIGRTGRLVTSAALILFFAFSALATSPGTDAKVLGTALGVGILIDATIVRALLVPALVSLFGRWNWWLPGWLARALFVEPSPLRPGPHRAPRGAAGAGQGARRHQLTHANRPRQLETDQP